VVRRLSPKQVIDGVYRMDEEALLDDRFHRVLAVGVMAAPAQRHWSRARLEGHTGGAGRKLMARG
jgi:hypothetical protein